MNRTRSALAALFFALMTAACVPTQPSEEVQADVCNAQADLEASFADFRDLDPETATIEDYRNAWTAVREDWFALRGFLPELSETNVDQLNSSVEDVQNALAGLSPDAPVSEIGASVESELADVESALSAISAEVDCPAS